MLRNLPTPYSLQNLFSNVKYQISGRQYMQLKTNVSMKLEKVVN